MTTTGPALLLMPATPEPPPSGPRSGSDAETGTGAAGRILVVEDDYFVGLTIEDALIEAGHRVLGVLTTGEEAVEAAPRLRPDLVLMDIRLAGAMNGVEAAIELRRQGIVCLFATAHSDEAMRASGDEAQPAGWLIKPFSGSELVVAVADALRRIRAN